MVIYLDKIVIEGGNPLKGKVQISGSKNAVLPIIAATLLPIVIMELGGGAF